MSRLTLIIFFVYLCCTPTKSENIQDIVSSLTSTLFGKNVTSPPSPSPAPQNKTKLVQVIDNALNEEFKKEDSLEDEEGTEFNKTVQTNKDASLETVVHVRHALKPSNSTDNQTASEYHHSPSKDQENETKNEDNDIENQSVDTIIDKQDNVFVMSTPHAWNALMLDPQLVQDLTVIYCASAIGGALFELIKQPVVSGFLVAGSIVGPGGLGLVQELVQVESLAQIGIQLLLFGLGLEFSISKLWPVKYVAIIGGFLQVFTFILLGGVGAFLIGAETSEGILIGAIVSMSSTSILVKLFEVSPRMKYEPFNQIVVGTLILQDCIVGLLFALIPVLGDLHTPNGGDMAIGVILRLSAKLLVSLIVVWLMGKYFFRRLVEYLRRVSTPELFQVALFGWCMFGAWVGGHIGISHELGAFLAGCILTSGSEQHHILEATEQVRNIFIGLFIASIGLIMSPMFLWRHFAFLAVSTAVVIGIKSLLVASVIMFFRYSLAIAFAVGTCLAQIGEFAFVLLGIGLQLKLIQENWYRLMLGVTAMSILVTPLILKITDHLLGSKEIVATQQLAKVVNFEPNEIDEEQDLLIGQVNRSYTVGGGLSGSQSTPNVPRVRKGSV